MSKSTVSDRFNAFHLETGVISERIGWILSHLGDDPGIDLIRSLHADLEQLLDGQDCRDYVEIVPLHPGAGQGAAMQAAAPRQDMTE